MNALIVFRKLFLPAHAFTTARDEIPRQCNNPNEKSPFDPASHAHAIIAQPFYIESTALCRSSASAMPMASAMAIIDEPP